MEQQQRSLVFTAAVGLIILAIIVGSIYYLVKFIQSRVASSRQTPQASVETFAQASGAPAGGSVRGSQISIGDLPQTGSIPSDNKTYNGGNFQLAFSKNWGLLSCANSANLELDPLNSADNKAECSIASKPITIIVDNISGCSGENIKIGNNEVLKNKKVEGGYSAYQWCTKTEPVLNITHRVSKGGETAVSPDDYSSQIEEMISKLTFIRGS